MKLSNQRHATARKSIELSMTSMIDVVFLLLIFFLVTTTFIKPEKQVPSGIKVEENAASKQTNDLAPAIVEIAKVGESVVFSLGAISTTNLSDLEKPLKSFENKQDGAFVRVGSGVPFEKVAQAIGYCKASGFDKVVYVPNK